MLMPYILIYLTLILICVRCFCSYGSGEERDARFHAEVEAEENVYSYHSSDNGADPLWSYGSSCIARIGEKAFISGVKTLPDATPLNNVQWQLFERADNGWKLLAAAPGRTREPCPLACFQDGTLFLSDNPTLNPNQRSGPARPEILVFPATDPTAPPERLLPVWDGQPPFTEHSYRSFAADGKNRELILFQNIGYTHAEWSFRDSQGKWSARGQLKWPWGAEYPEPEPIRICYPTVALRDRAVYFCGVSDIIEPYPQWRAYKKEVSGRDWDYDFRRLFFARSDDITSGKFHDWVEVSSRDKTCGWIFPNDLWVGPDRVVHLLWTERALDERLRQKFFPNEKQSSALMYARARDGKVELKRPIQILEEGKVGEVPGNGRFQVTADGRLFVLYYVSGTGDGGRPVSEDRLIEILRDGTQSKAVPVPLKRAFTRFFTATWRAGSPLSNVIDIYGSQTGSEGAMSYARIRIR
jgi:hypothetical protein